MLTYEFSWICDASKVLGQLCTVMWSAGTFNSPAGVSQSWLDARNHGWHIVNHGGEDRHLCPGCWRKFIEGRK